MSNLEQLFPEGRRQLDASIAPDESRADGLAHTLGAPRRGTAERVPVADVAALRRTVTEASASAGSSPMAGAPTATDAKRRRRRGVDVLSIAVAGVAVAAVVTAGTLWGVQAASASPAVAAVQLLEKDEATLINLETSLRTSVDAATARRDEARTAAVTLRDALREVRGTPDPRAESWEDAERLVVTEPERLTKTIKKLNSYIAALEEMQAPTLPVAYHRTDVDEASLEEVGNAIETVQTELAVLGDAVAGVRELDTTLNDLQTDLQRSLDAFAKSVPAFADGIADTNSSANDELRDAVRRAADAVVEADLLAGPASLFAYRDAVAELVIDQRRAEIEEAEERAREEEQRRRDEERRQREQQQNPDDGQSDGQEPGGSDGGEEPGGSEEPIDPPGNSGEDAAEW